MTTSRLSGRVAIVTGAASGIGRAIARQFAEEDAMVVAADVNAGRLRETVTLMPERAKPVSVVADLRDPEAVQRIVAAANDHGGADILVNNAGIMDWFLPAGEVDDETWARVMDVNVTAPMRLMRAVLPRMEEKGRGAIVNVASIGGLAGGTAGVAYTASKHALVGMTRNTAFFYGPEGIRTNAVCPGGVETNIAEGGAQPRVEWAFERLQTGFARAQRMAQPAEIAALVTWLVSDEAVNVNGAIIPSDGGWTAA